MTDFARLVEAFPPARISWRVGPTNKDKTKGMALAYIDARDVMERLDAAIGPAGWQCDYPHANGKTVCRIGIKVGDEWIWKADGAGDTDHEAEKGALSDAFKRAAVRWGIGRYLYDMPSPWVEIEERGRTYVIKESELPRLAKLLTNNAPQTAPAPVADPLPAQTAPGLRTYADQLLRQLSSTRHNELESMWRHATPELAARGCSTKDHPIYIELTAAFAARKNATMEAA